MQASGGVKDIGACAWETGVSIVGIRMKRSDTIDVARLFEAHPFAQTILRRLHDAGHEAVLIGGVVRDGLLSRMGRATAFPPDDVDIATSAFPNEIRKLFSRNTIVGVGEEFGVLVIVAPDGRGYEVATFRTEADYDGRWPARVELVRDLDGDVHRRDLTVNGLAARISGEVIDLVGGVDDLVHRRIRAIGNPDERFAEDYLRMLRVVRFCSQIDGEIDPATFAAVRTHAAQIASISQERIRDELLRLMQTRSAGRGVRLLDELGLLQEILPEVTVGKGVPQPEEWHPEGDVYVHTLLAVDVADRFVTDPLIKLAVLLHDIGKPSALRRSGGENMGGHCAMGARQAKRIAQRLRLSRADSARLVFLVKNHMRIADFPRMGRGKQVRFLSEGENPDAVRLRDRYALFFDLLQVLIADCEASAHRSSGWAPILQETVKLAEHVERVCGMNRARELIDGHTLIELGLPPGPKLGRILHLLHDRILAGEIRTRDEAIEEARTLISSAAE